MKSNRKLIAFLFGSTLVSGLATLNAQTTYTWNATTDAVFTETTNWTGGAIAPTSGTSNSRLNVYNTDPARPLAYSATEGTTIYSGGAGRALVIASTFPGNMVITGGTFDSRQSGDDLIGNGEFAGSLTINGGTYINTNAGSETFLVGLNGGVTVAGTPTLNIDSGNFTAGRVQFGQNVGINPGGIVAVVNLNGGILSTKQFHEQASLGNFGDTGNTLITSTVNFNGGTLRPLETGTIMKVNAVDTAAVQSGGAIIDTNNFDTTIAKALTAGSPSGGLTKQGAGTLTLSGSNTYTGDTTVTAGTLTLAPTGTQKFIIGATSINNKITGNATGTLNLNGKLLLDLATAGTTIGNSWNVVDVANFVAAPAYGGTLTVDSTLGAFTQSGGNWTKSENGVTYQFSQSSGNLSVIPGGASAYTTWAAQITNGLNLRTDDADGDGFNNLQEFLYGTSPIAGNGALVSTTSGGGNLVLRWLQRETGATYTLKQSTTLDTGSWSTVVSPVPALDGDQTGAPASYDYYTATLPSGSGKLFLRIEGVEN